MVQATSEFIPGLSQETTKLRQLTKKNVRFKWSKQYTAEFEGLKELLCNDALLTYFDPNLPTFLLVDVHSTALSTMLSQGKSADKARMVKCASRPMTPVEPNYPKLI